MMNLIILTAGQSSRMGENKALLRVENSFVLEFLLKKMMQITENIFVVTGRNKNEIEQAIKSIDAFGKVKIIYNENHHLGMFSSIQKGLNAIQNSHPILLQMIDQPFLPVGIYEKLVNSFQPNMKILQPSYQKKAGHPIIFNSQFKKIILNYAKTANLKEIINQHSEDRSFMDVDDERILQNLNTKEKFKEEMRREYGNFSS